MKKLGMFLIMILFFSSCIIGPSVKRVMSYRGGNVFLSDKSRYSVGILPEGWKRMRPGVYAIVFYNSALESTIATDAFCGTANEDIPLKQLTIQMLAGVEGYKILDQEEFMMDGRGALRTSVVGRVDGVPLHFDTVVIKKNRCTIDFMCISPEAAYTEASADFTAFYNAFRYDDEQVR